MHKRKKFLIYPPNYKPGDGFKVRHSKFQAWKVAMRMGIGAGIDVCVHIHPAARKNWTSSQGLRHKHHGGLQAGGGNVWCATWITAELRGGRLFARPVE